MAPARLLYASALLLSLSASALAQTYAVIDWTKVPSCAKKCTVLTSAESACIPPQQPVTSQNAYQSCFCSSQSLSGLYSSPQAVCSNVCSSQTDLETLKDWYVNLCTAGVVVTPGVAAANPKQTGTTTTTGSAATGTAALQGSGSQSSGGNNTWISTHWRWVIMLIVVFIGMISLAILGVCLKRRYRRKHDAEASNVGARSAPVLDPATINTSSSNHHARPSEMSMAGAAPVAAMGALPRPPRTLVRSRSNTAGTAGSRGSGMGVPNAAASARGYHSSSGDSLDKDIATDLPPPPHVYAGNGDLPERQYSPVVSRRSSAHVNLPGRPSSTQVETTAAAAAAAAMRSTSDPQVPHNQTQYATYDRHQNTPPTQPSPTLPPEEMFLPMLPPSGPSSRPGSRPGSSSSPVNFSRPPLASKNSDGAGAQRIREMHSQNFEDAEGERRGDAAAAAAAAAGMDNKRRGSKRLSKRGRMPS